MRMITQKKKKMFSNDDIFKFVNEVGKSTSAILIFVIILFWLRMRIYGKYKEWDDRKKLSFFKRKQKK